MSSIHLIKLVVGVKSLREFAENQPSWLVSYKSEMIQGGMANPVWTRYRPKRAEELLESGSSLYRVIKNQIVCRQTIIGFEQAEHPDKGTMCLIMTAPEIVRTVSTPRRPFQGWRYLQPDDAPDDVGVYDIDSEDNVDPEMEDELMKSGLI